jgi:hypothetical protein
MRHVSMKAILGTLAVGALLGGCATTVEMGPGYYHYDTGLAHPSAPPVVYQEPAVVYREPAVVYHQPTVVYRDPAVVYYGPTGVYRTGRDSLPYNDHGQ